MADEDEREGTSRRESPDKGKRVVLRQVPAGLQEADGVAWEVVDTVEADSDRKAIEAVAGRPGTPEAKPGTYKSVPAASWRGTAVYERPPEPIVGATWTD